MCISYLSKIKDQKWNAGNYKVIPLGEWPPTHNYGYPNRYSEQLTKAVLYFIRIDRINAGVSKIRNPCANNAQGS